MNVPWGMGVKHGMLVFSSKVQRSSSGLWFVGVRQRRSRQMAA